MAKPILFAIDDDPETLRAVERDLRRKYGSDYRVLRADSGPTALEALQQALLRNEAVALLLADQRMPHMSGVEFLEEARKIYPHARRVVLTAYADTEAAIRAINGARIDYYLLKPWDPPEEKLYPILDDLLYDWQAAHRPRFEGVRVIGHRWSPDSYRVKDFLARNRVPYQWIDIEVPGGDPESCRLIAAIDPDPAHLPVVLFVDGSCLEQPTNAQLAAKLGLQTQAKNPFYDLIIVGGGPAGLAAAVYGASEGLRTLLVEREAPGGQAGTSSHIDNYLGFPAGLTGEDLARRALDQARRFEVEIVSPQEVAGARYDDAYRYVQFADGSEIGCYALLIATGVSYRKLDIPGLDKLTGAGVYYGATMTEAKSCRDEDIYIVGGANSAGQGALYIARYARSVTMLVRADSLSKSMSQYLINQIEKTPNIHVRPCTRLVGVSGEGRLEAIALRDDNTGATETCPTGSLYIFIGAEPGTDWLANVVERDPRGFIYTGPELKRDGKLPPTWKLEREPFLLETSVPGIFVAGDVRHGSIKRVASGVGEGSIAVSFIHQYLSNVQ